MLPSVRFGGVLFLKGFELPDQAVVERLNALLELERSFLSHDDEPIPVHEQLFVVASAHVPSVGGGGGWAARLRRALPEGLSPAVVSRLTLVNVEPPTFAEFEEAYSGLLTRRIGGGDGARCVHCMFALLQPVGLWQPKLARQLTLGHLLRWCDYARQLDRRHWVSWAAGPANEQAVLLNLVLGGQILLLDQLEKPARDELAAEMARVGAAYCGQAAKQQLADPDASSGHCAQSDWVVNVRGEAHLRYLGFRLPGACSKRASEERVDFGRFEPSFSSVRNLSRILAARDTGHAINLVGPPGIGKSAVVEAAAQLLGRRFIRISCSSSLTVDDLFGTYR